MPIPRIKRNQVLVQVKGCGICGTDLHTYDWAPKARKRRGIPIPLPVIIGHEPAGIVTEVGQDVKNIKIGDRVVADSWGAVESAISVVVVNSTCVSFQKISAL